MEQRRSSPGRPAVARARQIDATQLEGGQPVGVAQVVLGAFQRTHQQTLAQRTALHGDGIGQRDVVGVGGFAAGRQFVVALGGGERIVDRVLQAAADQEVADLFFGLDRLVAMLGGQHVLHQRGANPLVADDAGHFLAQVGRIADVQAVPGRRTGQQRLPGVAVEGEGSVRGRVGRRGSDLLYLEVQASQRCGHLVQGDRHPQEPAHVANGGIDQRERLVHRVGVDDAGHDPPASIGGHERRRTAGRQVVEGGGDAARKAEAGLAGELERLAGAPVVDAVEGGRFQQNGAGGGADLALLAAHDARDGDGASRVGDHEHGVVQRALHIVQGGEFFTGRGAFHDDGGRGVPHPLGTRQQDVVVEGVERLPIFQHDIVGDIHHVADGAHAGPKQALLHPQGRRADGHILDHDARVAVAEGWLVDAHSHIGRSGIRCLAQEKRPAAGAGARW